MAQADSLWSQKCYFKLSSSKSKLYSSLPHSSCIYSVTTRYLKLSQVNRADVVSCSNRAHSKYGRERQTVGTKYDRCSYININDNYTQHFTCVKHCSKVLKSVYPVYPSPQQPCQVITIVPILIQEEIGTKRLNSL